jgi:hypothetical protein
MDPITAGLLGLAFSWASSALNQWQKEKEAKKQKEEEERLLKAKKDTYQKEYEFAKQEALKSADTAEKETTLAESLLGDNFNNNLKGLALQQQAQAIEREQSSISADSSIANAETSLGMSGLRGSSTQENIARQEEYNQDIQLFQHQQNEFNNEMTLANAFTGLNQGINGIQTQRNSIDDLRKSYEEGGRNKEMYDQEMANLDLSHEINMDRLDRSVQTSLSDVFGSIAGGFSMGSNLMNFSNQINQFGKDWGRSSTPFGNAIKPFKWN